MSKINKSKVDSNVEIITKISEQIRRNVELICNNSVIYRKTALNGNANQLTSNQIKTNPSIPTTNRSAMKKGLDVGFEDKLKQQKRVSFATKQLNMSEIKGKEIKTKSNIELKRDLLTIEEEMKRFDCESDSETEQLCIDLSNPSVSDSNDSFESSGRMLGQNENKSNLWTNSFDEKRGDSSKVIEITVEDEDSDRFEVIEPKHSKHFTSDKFSDKSVDFIDITDKLLSEKKVEESYETINETTAQTSDNCVNTSQTVFTKINKPTDKYICIFCPQICESSETMKDHYLSHCGIYLICGECDQKFNSLQTYRKHNSKHLDRNKMLNLEQFMNAKKWCDLYVDYIEKHEELVDNYIETNEMFCSVCHKLKQFYKMNEKNKKYENSVKIDDQFIRNHLHQHLNYYPFECIDCRFDDKKTEFYLNSKARQHLLDVHNVENAFVLETKELKTYFDEKKSIKRLDEIIDDCIKLSAIMKDFLDISISKCDKRKIFIPLLNN